jgi:hypothetical protein
MAVKKAPAPKEETPETALDAMKKLAKDILKMNEEVQALKHKVERLEEYNASQGYVKK